MTELRDSAGPAFAPPPTLAARACGPTKTRTSVTDLSMELDEGGLRILGTALDRARQPPAGFSRLSREFHVDSPHPVTNELHSPEAPTWLRLVRGLSHPRTVAQTRRSLTG